MITFMPMLMWVAALIGASASLDVAAQKLSLVSIGRALLSWLFIFPLGTQAVLDFVTYGFLPQTMADQFGWAPSPFQMQVAFANLGLGAASFYAAFAKRPARIAVGLAVACYLVGSGLSLVNNILDGDDLAAGVASAVLLQNFLTPVAVLMLLFLLPQRDQAGARPAESKAVPAPQGLRPQPAPGAPPPAPALAPPRPQTQVYARDERGYGQASPEFGTPDPYDSQGRYGQSDPLGKKLASGLQERAPWESSSGPAARKPPSTKPAPRTPVQSPKTAPRPSSPPPRAQPRPQPPSPPQPRYDPPRPSDDPPLPNFDPPQPRYDDFDQSLEDELERARRQLMEDLQKGRKPGSY